MSSANRSLQNPNPAAGGIETRDQQIPTVLMHGAIARHQDLACSVMQPETATTGGINYQRYAFGRSVLATHDTLGCSFTEPGRHHECCEGNCFAANRVQVWNVDVGADCDSLPSSWIGAVNLRVNRSGLEARAVWAIVTANETNNVNAETLTAVLDADLQFRRVPRSR